MARIHRFPVLAVIAFILCASSASGRDPIHVFTIDPPKDIKEQFNKLQRGENRTTAVLSLAARDESAPYIRFEIEHTEDRSYARDLSVALREIESRIQQRNNTRFNWWGKTHRFDLCSELLAICSEKKAAESLITHVMPQLQAVGREASDRLDRQYRTPHNFSFGKGFERDRNLIHIADKHVVIPRGLGTNNTIVRAETCEIGPPVMIGWFVACRSHLSYSKDSIGSDEWIQSIIIVNNGMSIRAADSSLFICDGDVELLD